MQTALYSDDCRHASSAGRAADLCIPHLQQVIRQITWRAPASEKLVSIFGVHTAIIRKGKLGKLTELGWNAWLAEVKGGMMSVPMLIDF